MRIGKSLILCNEYILCEQVDYVEVVDILYKVCYKCRALNEQDIWHCDLPEYLEICCSIDLCTLDLICRYIHQNTCCDQHLVWNTDPDIDENDHYLCPVRIGQERYICKMFTDKSCMLKHICDTNI